MTVTKRIMSHITLMGFVDTMTVGCLALLLTLSTFSPIREIQGLKATYDDIKHSRLEDQQTIASLREQMEVQRTTILTLEKQVGDYTELASKNAELTVRAESQREKIQEMETTLAGYVEEGIKNRELILNVSAYTLARDETSPSGKTAPKPGVAFS